MHLFSTLEVLPKYKIGLHFFSGILDSNGADASQIAAALKKSARKKRGGIIGGSLPSVGLDQDETQEIIVKEEEPSGSTISTPGKFGFWCFTSVLVFGYWLMNHVTYLKLRKK